jgi:hypothetical protein
MSPACANSWRDSRSEEEEALRQQRVEPVDTTVFGRGYRIRADRFSYSVKPTLAQSRWAVEDFCIPVGVMASASYWLTDRLLLDGGVFANLYNNYDKFKSSLLPADSSLPRVRTHIRDYVSNDVYINNLQANYVDALGHGLCPDLWRLPRNHVRRRGSRGALAPAG